MLSMVDPPGTIRGGLVCQGYFVAPKSKKGFIPSNGPCQLRIGIEAQVLLDETKEDAHFAQINIARGFTKRPDETIKH